MQACEWKIMAAPAACTEDSVALLWEEPEGTAPAGYAVYRDGGEAGSCACTDFTAEGLAAGREYCFYVCALDREGRELQRSGELVVRTPEAGPVCRIESYGAVGDGRTLNTRAIQAAIDDCGAGGRVVVPAGCFVTGALFLKSDMTLYLEEGAVLLGSADPGDYPLMQYRWEGREALCYASLINTRDMDAETGYFRTPPRASGVAGEELRLHDITIEGKGKIDANGEALKRGETAEGRAVRGRAVCLRNADRVYLRGITVKQSPAWCVHLIYCRDVSINGVSVYTNCDEDGVKYRDIMNGDGIDSDSCANVAIFHSMVASQDDCIAVKSGRDGEGRAVGIPTEHVRITNCTFRSGFGVAIGSEMSGGVRDVDVRDCVFENTYSVGSVKAPRGRGGVVEDIRYSDIAFRNLSTEHSDCRWFRGAIYVDQFYSHEEFDPDLAETADEGTALIRNISFENIRLETVAGNAVYLAGLPEQPLQGITLKNVTAAGKYGLKAYNVEGLALTAVEVTAGEGEAYQLKNVTMS